MNNKMQATIPRHLFQQFGPIIRENRVYDIFYLHVIRICDASIFSHSGHRVVFCLKTVVDPSQSLTIDQYGLSLIAAKEILTQNGGSNCLVDTIGVLTTRHFESIQLPSNGITPVFKFELADLSGRFPCVLTGRYVDEFREMLSKSPNDHPVIVLQFAKISTDRGYVCIENCKELTRVLTDSSISHILEFKTRLTNAGGFYSLIHRNQVNSFLVPDISKFDGLYPHKTVRQLIDTLEPGFFVVCAKVVLLVGARSWWYPVCKCGQFLDICDTSYLCPTCQIHVFCVYPKFKLQIGISDGTSTALIQLTGHPLHGINAINNYAMGAVYSISHYGCTTFGGKDLLLIVNKSRRSENRFEDYVEVVNITDEAGCLHRFHELGKDFTPAKSICGSPFVQSYIDVNEDELPPDVSPYINKGKSVMVDTSPEVQTTCFDVGNTSNTLAHKAGKDLSTVFDGSRGEGLGITPNDDNNVEG